VTFFALLEDFLSVYTRCERSGQNSKDHRRDPYHVVSDYWVAHSEIDLLIVHHTSSYQIGEIGADRLLKFLDQFVLHLLDSDRSGSDLSFQQNPRDHRFLPISFGRSDRKKQAEKKEKNEIAPGGCLTPGDRGSRPLAISPAHLAAIGGLVHPAPIRCKGKK
jgi:hypothetical protein